MSFDEDVSVSYDCSDLRSALESVQERAHTTQTSQMSKRRQLTDKKEHNLKQLQVLTHKMKDKICHMVEDVERKVPQRKVIVLSS